MRTRSLAAFAIALACCAPEPGLGVAIRARGGLEVGPGGDLDELEVRVVASQASEPELPYTCEASSRRFPEAGVDLELPVTVVIRPGELPWRSLGLEVTGLSSGDVAIRAEAFFATDLAGVAEETLWLDAACLDGAGAAPCGGGEVCVAWDGVASCEPSDLSQMLEDPAVALLPCDSEP